MDQTKGIRDGIADLGQFVTPYEVGRSPILGVYELPFTFVSMDKEVETNRELMKAGIEKFMIETQNVKPLAAQRTWPYNIWTSKKIERMEDLKGVKMRTPGGMQADGMTLLGATPVTIAAGEVYIGLQHGTIDGTLYTPAFVASRQLHEVAKYGLLVPFSVTGGIFVINLNTWKRLPPHIQDTVVQAANEMEASSIRCIEAAEKKQTEEFQKQGVHISTLTKEEEARWVRTVRPLWDKYAAENGELGKHLLSVMKKVKNLD
jgi:TRAP-type C4-dicarboxylate transport system substrate-binding protein